MYAMEISNVRITLDIPNLLYLLFKISCFNSIYYVKKRTSGDTSKFIKL